MGDRIHTSGSGCTNCSGQTRGHVSYARTRAITRQTSGALRTLSHHLHAYTRTLTPTFSPPPPSPHSAHRNQTNNLSHMYVCVCFAGVLEAEFYEADVDVIPITFPFATSHIWWPINQANKLNIKFDFRSSRTTAVLAYGEVTTSEGNGFWEVSALRNT